MRTRIPTFAVTGLLVASLALAQSVHFVRGPIVSPDTDTSTTQTVSGKLAGLGEGDVTLLLSVAGVADVECTNPGGNVAPGQDTEVTTTGSATLPSPKNGNLVFSVTTIEPSIPSSACPNNQWTAEATDVDFGAGTLTVIQGGQVVLTQPI
jgi:hypothetical protein